MGNKVLLSLLIFGLIASSCSTIESPRYSEPKKIAIKNSSGVQLYEVSLKEKAGSAKGSIRMGQISPVPIGATQLITRPSSPPPLPKQVIISWVDQAQRQYAREIFLEKVLNNSDEMVANLLVFEIGPSGKVRAYTE